MVCMAHFACSTGVATVVAMRPAVAPVLKSLDILWTRTEVRVGVCLEDGPTMSGRTHRRDCGIIRSAGATTLGDKCNGATGGTAADATDATNATAVGIAGHAAADDATAADADDGTAATDAAEDATVDDVHAAAAGKHDGIPATVWRARPVRADLLTRRGGFN